MHASRAQDKLCCDGRIEVVVLFEADVVGATTTVEHLQRDLAGLLASTRETRDCQDAFQNLAADDGLFRQTG